MARYTPLLGIVLFTLLASYSPADTLAGGSVGGAGQVRYGTSQRKGFDTCSAPSVTEMQAWWNYSPYYDTIIYMGGSTRICPQPNLNSSWVSTLHNQGQNGDGWDFYLTWAGPQAPCNRGSINLNTFTAYNQGKQEADRADAAAWNLGFTGYNIYYYDMENYDETNQACRNAVNSFLNGWDYQNRYVYGNMVGIYGNGCDASTGRPWRTCRTMSG